MSEQIQNVKCGFFDAVDNDRVYSANDMMNPYKRIVSDGVFATPQGTPSNDFHVHQTATASMSIIVDAGEAIIGHRWFYTDVQMPLNVPVNTGLSVRKDSVILQVDERITGRVGNIVYRTGTTEVPALDTSAGVTEYRLANIEVAAGATSITDAEITDLRGNAIPWVTAVIIQPDTSTMWQNFYNAYEQSLQAFEGEQAQYQQEQRQAWNDFITGLTEELSVTMNLVPLKSTFTTTATMTTIPINIASYDATTDILLVFINGLLASPSMYTEDGTNAELTNALAAGNKVDFLCLKSVAQGDIASTTSLIVQLQNLISNFMGDTGWVNLTLTNGASVVTPQIRNIGGKVYLRGTVSGISTGAKIADVPYKPEKDFTFVAASLSGASYVGISVVTVKSNGEMIANNAAGNICLDAHYLSDSVASELVTNIPNAETEEF